MTHVEQTSVSVQLVTGGGARSPRGAELPGLGTLRQHSLAGAAHPAVPAVSVRADGDRLDVLLAGDVEAAVTADLASVEARVDRHCAHHARARVHVDVREVTAVDASAVRFLERLRDVCAARGASCTTSGARPAVERVLALARPVADGALAAS